MGITAGRSSARIDLFPDPEYEAVTKETAAFKKAEIFAGSAPLDHFDDRATLFNIATPTIPPPTSPLPELPPGDPPPPPPGRGGPQRDPDGILRIDTAEGRGGGWLGAAIAGGAYLVGSLINIFRGNGSSSPPPAPTGPAPPAARPPAEPNRVDRLAALPGTGSYGNLAEAGAKAGQLAYEKTFSSAGDVAAKFEYGAFIFEYQGKTFTAPLTAGNSEQDGQAEVKADQMMADLIRHIGQVGIKLSDIVVVGLVHSHPSRPGFGLADDPDIKSYEMMSKMKTWMDKGAIPMNFQRSYIWGPRSLELGGRDPVGQLYPYPP